VLAVSAKPVSATVLKQYIATTMKPATTRAKSDFLAIFRSFLVSPYLPSANINVRTPRKFISTITEVKTPIFDRLIGVYSLH